MTNKSRKYEKGWYSSYGVPTIEIMESITLNSSEEYKRFLDLVAPNTNRVSIFLLQKDKTPSLDFLKILDNIVQSLDSSEGGRRKGYSGSIE